MTATQTRVTAGLPTGGQFAASSHGEAEDTVLVPTGPNTADLGVALDNLTDPGPGYDEATSVVAMKTITANLRELYPTARYLGVDWSDQGNCLTTDGVFDENGERLDDADAELDLSLHELDHSQHTFGSALSFVDSDTVKSVREGDMPGITLDLELVDHLHDPAVTAPSPPATALPMVVQQRIADLRAREPLSNEDAAAELRKLLTMLGDPR